MSDLSRPGAMVIGMLMGASVGLLIERVPAKPMLQAVGAALLSCVVTSVGASLLWLKHTGQERGAAAISFGIVEGLVSVTVVLSISLFIYWVLGWMAQLAHPAFAAHRGAILGAVGGLLGALAAPLGTVIRTP